MLVDVKWLAVLWYVSWGMRIHQNYMQLIVQLTSQSFDTGYATTVPILNRFGHSYLKMWPF